jgi:hypothetical protein
MDWFKEYRDYTSTKAWYQKLAKENAHLVEFNPSIGTSHEGRDIFMVKIGGQRSSAAAKKVVWLTR